MKMKKIEYCCIIVSHIRFPTQIHGNEQKRQLCTFANKGNCRYQNDDCKYRHERCQNYNRCSRSDCPLAHAPRNFTESPISDQKLCLSGMQYYEDYCRFPDPVGWSACRSGMQCINYDCNSNHPPDRRKKCPDGNQCNNMDKCQLLHPNNYANNYSQRNNFQTPSGAKSFPIKQTPSYTQMQRSLAMMELSDAKSDFLKQFGHKILDDISKQPGIHSVKVDGGKIQLSGSETVIAAIDCGLQPILHEQRVTISDNLKKYLELTAKGFLLKKFVTKYRVGLSFSQMLTNVSSAILETDTTRTYTTKNVGGKKEKQYASNYDRSKSEDEEYDDSMSDTSDVSLNNTTISGNFNRRHNCTRKLIKVTLCNDSQDLLSRAIRELKNYDIHTRSWALTQDEIAYILQQLPGDKSAQLNTAVRDQRFQIQYRLIGLIQSTPNSIAHIVVNHINGGIQVIVNGFKEHVDNAVSKIKTHLNDNVEAELQLPISKAMAVFLRRKALSDIQKLEKTHGINVTVVSSFRGKHANDEQNDSNDCLKLIGSVSSINSAKANVDNFLESLSETEKPYPCPSWDIAKTISEIIIARLKEMLHSYDSEAIGWIKTYTTTDRRTKKPNVTLTIVGFNEEAVDDVDEQCQNIVEGYVVWNPSPAEYQAIICALIRKKCPSLDEFRQQWNTNIQLRKDTSNIIIPARSKEIADDIKKALLSLGEENKHQMKRIDELIPIRLDIRRFVNQAIGPFLSEAKSQNIFIELKNRNGLKLHGHPDSVSELKQKISSMIDSIEQKITTRRLQLLSIESVLLRANAYKIIKAIERDTNTIIHDVTATTSRSTLKANDDGTSLLRTSVVNSRGQTIIVQQGDITKIKNVDAIVNAANGQLYHAGGVDKAIADAAGPAFDKECQQIIAKNDGLPIAAGKAVKTTAGNLPFKCIIHAIGPQFSDGNQQERPLLFFSVLSSMRIAEEEGCTSIAVPAISSRTYGFPRADCTNIVVRAIKQFFADYPQSQLRKIILTDIDDAACSSFAREVIIDHRNTHIDDDAIMNYELAPLTAKWCWQDDDGEKIYDDNHTRQIENAFQDYLQSSSISTLSIPADNLRSGKIVNYTIHFCPDLKQRLASNPSILGSRLVCGHQTREITGFERNIIRYPVIKITSPTSVAYSPNPLDLYRLQTVTTTDDWNIFSITDDAITKAETAMREAIKSATVSEQYSVSLDKDIAVHEEQITSIAIEHQIQIEFQRECSAELSMVLKGLKPNVQEAKLKITLYAHDILKRKVDNDNELSIPKEWGDQQENFKLVEITRNDPNFISIENRMRETISNVKIDKIERVQNVRMWQHYAFRRQQLKKELSLMPGLQIEMELFHGTKTTSPSEVYNGEYGFDMTFSISGMWGLGTYFAKNASYSCSSYAHRLPTGKCQAFLAQVLTGDVYDCPQDSSLRRPPKKNESISGLRYNSVSGDTGGSKVYIVYENRVAYPTYLITFTL